MNKIIITTIAIFCAGLTQAQLAVGKDEVSSSSVSIEFGDSESRGLLLPWVENTIDMTDAVNGTLVFDRFDSKVKVKYRDTGWTDLSIQGYDSEGHLQPDVENLSAKVSIGTPTETPGILVLEDNDKAMVLPKVEDTDDVVNPSAGMMVYIESKNLLAVFDGVGWNFWKAGD